MFKYECFISVGRVVFTFTPQEKVVRGRPAYHVSVVCEGAGDAVFEVFASDDYSPSPLRRGNLSEQIRSWAWDVVSFAESYAERPEEFGRAPEECEQTHAAWWHRLSEELACELGE